MRILDETKTKELNLEKLDFQKGYLKADKLLIQHHNEIKGQAEKGHYEIVKMFPNGGGESKWVVDIPFVQSVEAWDEYEDIQVFVEYTEKELAEKEILILKQKLNASDCKVIKYTEGILSLEEYEVIKKQREEWRNQINELEGV
jgi:hypothetical protein